MRNGLRRSGKLTSLAVLLIKHGEAIEADLFVRGIDLLDLYRPDAPLTLRRVWVLVQHLLLQRGTALAGSINGDRGRWTRLDEMVAMVLGITPPEDRTTTEWRAAQQERIRKKRAEREALLQADAAVIR